MNTELAIKYVEKNKISGTYIECGVLGESMIKTVDTLLELIDDNMTDKNTVHSYVETYDEKFLRFKNTNKNILEIGVYNGGSIKLWHSYFINAQIFGIDISLQNCDEQIKNLNRVNMLNADAYDINTVNQLPKFDLIIEDGSHILNHIKFVAANYTKILNPNGLLIIEDIQDENWIPKIIDSFPDEYRSKVEVIDLRKNKNRYDDILIVLDLKN